MKRRNNKTTKSDPLAVIISFLSGVTYLLAGLWICFTAPTWVFENDPIGAVFATCALLLFFTLFTGGLVLREGKK